MIPDEVTPLEPDSTSILLVDDRLSNLVALEAVLEPLGAHLVRANGAEEALSAVKEREFAVILLDVQMPGMNGAEFRQLQRRDRELLRIPTVVITGAASEPLLDLAIDEALRKPVRRAELMRVVERHCGPPSR